MLVTVIAIMIRIFFTVLLVSGSLTLADKTIDVETPVSMYEAAILHLKETEGFRGKPYYCPAGYLTIGYGTQIQDASLQVDKRKATSMLVNKYKEIKDQLYKDFPDNKEHEIVALTLLVYNLGYTKFRQSKLYQNVKTNSVKKSEWLSYCKYKNKLGIYVTSKSLKQRREYEWLLYSGNHREINRHIQKYKSSLN